MIYTKKEYMTVQSLNHRSHLKKITWRDRVRQWCKKIEQPRDITKKKKKKERKKEGGERKRGREGEGEREKEKRRKERYKEKDDRVSEREREKRRNERIDTYVYM